MKGPKYLVIRFLLEQQRFVARLSFIYFENSVNIFHNVLSVSFTVTCTVAKPANHTGSRSNKSEAMISHTYQCIPYSFISLQGCHVIVFLRWRVYPCDQNIILVNVRKKIRENPS